MVNIFRSLFLSSIGIVSIAWLSFIFISMCLTEPPIGLVEYFANNIIAEDRFDDSGQSFAQLSKGLFLLVGHMNIFLLSFTIAVVMGSILWFTKSAQYFASDYIGGGGETILLIFQTIYYFLIYYIGVLLGTARFARSSVLLANNLPGNL